MARFITVGPWFTRGSSHRVARLLTGAGLAFLLGMVARVEASTPPASPAPVAKTNASASTPPAMTASIAAPMATNAPAGTPPPDTLNLYGKIVAPSNDTSHPLKLNLPFPGVGEMKIPSQDELTIRDKLEQLGTLSDAEIRAKLDQWPAYASMCLRDQGTMLQRIQDFRDHRAKVAQDKERKLGLLTLTPDQEARFEKEYWDKRLQMEHDLVKQFEPILKAREQKMESDLFREFSVPANAGIPASKPSPPPAPVVPGKTSPSPPAPASSTPNASPPMH